MNLWCPRTVLGFLAGFLIAVAPSRAGQAGDTVDPPLPSRVSMGPIIPFLEATDVFWSFPDFSNSGKSEGQRDHYQPPFKLEANIFPHLIFRQTFTDVLELDSQDKLDAESKKEFAYSISGTPGVRLRMLTSESSPVRTPSFTPRINLQGLWARGLKRKLSRSRQAAATGRIGLYEVHARIAHYSNGQEGCLSSSQSRDHDNDQAECGPGGAVLTRDTINRKDGSFSTNFLAIGAHYMSNKLQPEGSALTTSRDWLARRELRVGAELEGHFLNDDIKAYYSSWRVNVSAGAAWRDVSFCDRRLDIDAAGTLGLDHGDAVSNRSWSVQATCLPLNRGGWGLFVRYVGGQDYYNVQLFETIQRIQVGLTFNQGGFFGFRSRPSEATKTGAAAAAQQ